MKKFKLILCLCACVLGLTACGQNEDTTLGEDVATELESRTQGIITDFLFPFGADAAAGLEEMGNKAPEYMEYMIAQQFGLKAEGNAIVSGVSSWNKALDEVGTLQNITAIDAKRDEQGSDIIVTAYIVGEKRTAQVEAIYEDDIYYTLSSLTTNVDYTFGEKMSKAGLNTLMGMGTVFAVLILICLIISLFKYISVIQNAFTKKAKEEPQAASADTAIAQIIEKEELTDDLELIAVITAAIAASGTSGSADDFVVRSIRRKANSQWNKA